MLRLTLCFISSTHRCLFHRHAVVRLEGDRHHAGQLLAPVHPEIPAQTLLTSQLLQADHLKLINKTSELRHVTGLCFIFFFLLFVCCCLGDSRHLHRLCFTRRNIKGISSRWLCLKCNAIKNLLICAICSHTEAMQLNWAPRGPWKLNHQGTFMLNCSSESPVRAEGYWGYSVHWRLWEVKEMDLKWVYF